MTKVEIAKLLSFTAANFPGMQEKDLTPTAALWEKMLADIPYNIAEMALIKVLTTAKYFPTIAEIREAVTYITQPRQITAMEAWEEVRKAIRDYGYYREDQALNTLPPAIRSTVKAIGWREICISDNPEVIRAQFRGAYEANANRKHQEDLLPEGVRQLIFQARPALTEGEKPTKGKFDGFYE